MGSVVVVVLALLVFGGGVSCSSGESRIASSSGLKVEKRGEGRKSEGRGEEVGQLGREKKEGGKTEEGKEVEAREEDSTHESGRVCCSHGVLVVTGPRSLLVSSVDSVRVGVVDGHCGSEERVVVRGRRETEEGLVPLPPKPSPHAFLARDEGREGQEDNHDRGKEQNTQRGREDREKREEAPTLPRLPYGASLFLSKERCPVTKKQKDCGGSAQERRDGTEGGAERREGNEAGADATFV